MTESRQNTNQSASKAARRVCLVTGGARGFGLAIAVRMARGGHDVAVIDVIPAGETEALVRETGARFVHILADITSRPALEAAAAAITKALGPVDVLVANAAICPIEPLLQASWENWRRTMDVNVDATFHLFQVFLPGMVERGWGRVIAVVSGAFHSAPPGFSAYVASKGAVIGLVRAASREVGPAGVTVNAVAPPIVETPGVAAGPQRAMGVFEMVLAAQSIKREGRVGDLTGPIAFLASDEAEFATGQTLLAEGGLQFL